MHHTPDPNGDRHDAIDLLRALPALADTLSRAVSPEQVAEAVVAHGLAVFGASGGRFALVDADPAELVSIHPTNADAAHPRRIPLNSPDPLAEAVRKRDVIEAASDTGALLTAPLTSRGEVLGVFGWSWSGARRYSTADRAYLQAVACLAAQTIERVRAADGERRFRAAFKQAPVGLVLFNPATGRFLAVNGAACALTGYTANELRSKTWYDITRPEDLEAGKPAGDPTSYRMEARCVLKDGREVWVDLFGAIVRDAPGSPAYGVGAIVDISDRKLAEERARQRAEEVEAVMDVMPVAVWLTRDRDCRKVVGNRTGYEMLRSAGGANLSLSAPANDRPAHFRVFKDGRELAPEELPLQYAASHGVEVRGCEEELVFSDGGTIHLYGAAVPLFDEAGRVRGAVAAFQDVSELRRAEAALRDADRRKDVFLATLAHELRNPLVPLRNGLELLAIRAGGPGGEPPARILDMMDRQLGQMVRLIDDLLDVSRISRGKLKLRRHRVSLAEIVHTALETTRPLFEASAHRLDVSLPAGPIVLDADSVRLAQVLTNLLTNAAKYTDRGGLIRLAAEADGEAVVVSVADNGIGIPTEQLPRVFEMFSQAATAQDRSQGGMGIGLSLVKALTEMHGGTAEARSDGPGHGSEFVVRIPLAPPLRDRPASEITPGAARR